MTTSFFLSLFIFLHFFLHFYMPLILLIRSERPLLDFPKSGLSFSPIISRRMILSYARSSYSLTIYHSYRNTAYRSYHSSGFGIAVISHILPVSNHPSSSSY